MEKEALVFVNGIPVEPSVWSDLLQNDPLLVAADGGANGLKYFGIMPHLVIGDMDSLENAEELEAAGVLLIRKPEQDNTDLEKALDFLIEQEFYRVTVLGATGIRSDHTLANFSILLKYHSRMSIRIRDAYSDISVVSGECVFSADRGTLVSLIPMERCSGVTTEGLQWPLRGERLAPGVRESISNCVVSSPVKITVEEGTCLLFVGHNR